MKKVINAVKSNIRQILEIFVIIGAAILPQLVNLETLFKPYLDDNYISPDNWYWYLPLSQGKPLIMVALFIVAWLAVRKFNSNFIMNSINVYHDYPYGWYWFCAKVLGIHKCNLILVPIYMQFKLVINATFNEFPLNSDEYPTAKTEKIEVTKIHTNQSLNEINILLEDTYPIKNEQIPISKRNLLTIKISRNDGTTRGRHFSQNFVETTINTVRTLDTIKEVNLYATTNPLNTMHIAKRVFSVADRGNIKHLYVFQQNNAGIRAFQNKGHKIY